VEETLYVFRTKPHLVFCVAELGVGLQTDGVEVRSVGNTITLHDTALVEAFNLKAAIEYQLKNGTVQQCALFLYDTLRLRTCFIVLLTHCLVCTLYSIELSNLIKS
jgi:hypothetical protein